MMSMSVCVLHSDRALCCDSYFVFQVGARLISHAGSLTNLAKYPASTVQILGAEKALFRYWGAPSLLGKVATVMAGLGWSRAG